MSTFQSTVTINKATNIVYQFLADMNNHQQLMPDDISDWSSTVDEARFTIRNMIKLALKIEERTPDTAIRIIPAEKPPFDLELKWVLSGNEDHTEVHFTIAADLNMMMKMVASGPLQKLADDETANLLNILN
ncbi:SRPBCC family protein [Mucilaginibacter sp. X5P1]|uniref:SRPBCC family protein n=1 Tax=Mucilaginibacter sp. X5P1 TaxID=2723088 RepID=UPI00161DBB7C|nr:SRPBCC family protein [Mucilaginibacter sp. X5P1]MBB6136636.1 carbon monoxide dehydrogenase subunit G [Mucilaginibacter sp. X5P1]